MAKTKGLVLEATLKGVTPKGTKDGGYYDPQKKTVISLNLDVELPAVQEIVTFKQWQTSWQHGQQLIRDLEQARDKAIKAIEKKKQPEDVTDEAWAAQLAEEARPHQEAFEQGVRGLYEEYVEKTEAQQRTAFGALAGVGVFMALLNQKLSVHFFPSSKVFQPMLASLSEQVKALPSGDSDEDEDGDA